MTWLNPGRWALYGALIAALLAGWQWRERIVTQREFDRVTAIYAAQALKAEQGARAKEQALQDQITKAVKDAKQREKTLLADAGRARAATDGLRIDLAAATRRLSTASRDAVNQYAATAAGLLGDCSAAYSDVAAKASGHSSDALTLQSAWPKN